MWQKIKPFTNFESLIDLQEGNSIDTRCVLHSTTVSVNTIGRVSSQMKKNFELKSLRGGAREMF